MIRITTGYLLRDETEKEDTKVLSLWLQANWLAAVEMK